MASRWLHTPTLHSPQHGHERRVGWLELFYDLVYVAAFIQLGNTLSANIGIDGFLAFAGLMVPLWLTWTSFTFYTDRFVVDDALHRGLVFLQMFTVAGMAVCVPDILEHQPRDFALFYAAGRAVLASMYLRAWRQEPLSRDLTGRYVVLSSLAALAWFVSAFVPEPWIYGLWAVGVALSVSGGMSRHARALATRFPPDVLHMTERYGLLTIIVLGESFVKVLTELAALGLDAGRAGLAVMGMLVTCCLWWIYFDDVAGSRIKHSRLAPYVWVSAHLPLTIAITAVGVGVKKVVAVPDAADPVALKYRLLFAGTVALVLLWVGIIDAVTQRRQAELSDVARVKARV
ncbi:MAG: low temperature requirement protein A, partial [Deltaproteobacteria bacterium]